MKLFRHTDKIKIDRKNKTHVVEGQTSQTLMQLIDQSELANPYGICGGEPMCGTCHVYVEKQWLDKYGNEVIEKWRVEFTRRHEQISKIRNVSESSKWKIIEMDYIENLSSEYITRKIKDCS